MTYDQRTRDYIQRKQQEGKGTKEILRCLKRAIAREVFTLITNPTPVVDHRKLRPLRQERGLIQLQAAAALGISIAKIHSRKTDESTTLPSSPPTKHGSETPISHHRSISLRLD